MPASRPGAWNACRSCGHVRGECSSKPTGEQPTIRRKKTTKCFVSHAYHYCTSRLSNPSVRSNGMPTPPPASTCTHYYLRLCWNVARSPHPSPPRRLQSTPGKRTRSHSNGGGKRCGPSSRRYDERGGSGFREGLQVESARVQVIDIARVFFPTVRYYEQYPQGLVSACFPVASSITYRAPPAPALYSASQSRRKASSRPLPAAAPWHRQPPPLRQLQL